MGPWKPNVKTSLANSVGIDLFQFQVASGTVMFRFKAQLVSVFYHEWHKASPTPFLFLASFPNICNTFLLPLYQSLFSFSKAPIWSASMQYGSKGDGYSGSSVKDDNIVSLFCRLFPSLAGEGGFKFELIGINWAATTKVTLSSGVSTYNFFTSDMIPMSLPRVLSNTNLIKYQQELHVCIFLVWNVRRVLIKWYYSNKEQQ